MFLRDWQLQISREFQLGKHEEVTPEIEEVNARGIYTEIISQNLDKNVAGLRTDFKIRNRQLVNGRTAVASDFPNSVTHYNNSGNWPERFKMYGYQTVGWKFMARGRLSGYSTRTFCNWYDDTVCMEYWEYGSEVWVDVDGPFQVKAIVYYFNYTDYAFEWNNW